MAAKEPNAETHVIQDLAQLKALADPLRVRILEALVEEARTTKQVAQRIGEKPTKLYHHVDALEKVGLITLERTRQNRGTLEKYFRAIARIFRADSQLFTAASGQEEDSWQATAARLLEQSAGEVLRVEESPDEPEAFVASVMIGATEPELELIRGRLQEVFEEITGPGGRPGDPESEPAARQVYRLVIGFYPMGGEAAVPSED